jgi:hypothetical protein
MPPLAVPCVNDRPGTASAPCPLAPDPPRPRREGGGRMPRRGSKASLAGPARPLAAAPPQPPRLSSANRPSSASPAPGGPRRSALRGDGVPVAASAPRWCGREGETACPGPFERAAGSSSAWAASPACARLVGGRRSPRASRPPFPLAACHAGVLGCLGCGSGTSSGPALPPARRCPCVRFSEAGQKTARPLPAPLYPSHPPRRGPAPGKTLWLRRCGCGRLSG